MSWYQFFYLHSAESDGQGENYFISETGACHFGLQARTQRHPTHRVVDESLKKLPALYGLVEFLAAARIAVDEDGMSEKTTGLPRQDHQVPMYEASAKARGPQVRVLLSRRHFHVPYSLPRRV